MLSECNEPTGITLIVTKKLIIGITVLMLNKQNPVNCHIRFWNTQWKSILYTFRRRNLLPIKWVMYFRF